MNNQRHTLSFANTKIKEFLEAFKMYKDLINQVHSAQSQMYRPSSYDPNTDLGFKKIEETRLALNRQFGSVEEYIEKWGNKLRWQDSISGRSLDIYQTALSSDRSVRCGAAINAVLQDLNQIIGKLENMDEQEFAIQMYPPQPTTEKKLLKMEQKPRKNWWQMTHPVWLTWRFKKFILFLILTICLVWLSHRFEWLIIWEHKLTAIVIGILGLIAIDYAIPKKNIKKLLEILFK